MDLIEAHYAVGHHLQVEAERLGAMAEMLLKIADRMSEERMREQPKQSSESDG